MRKRTALVSRHVCGAAVASLMCLSVSAARAQQPVAPQKNVLDRAGFDLSARVAFALPLGDLMSGWPLRDRVLGAVPLVIELGVRVNKNVAVGVGVGLEPTISKNCSNCFSTDDSYKLNLETIFTARAGLVVDPWLGLGVGYEWANLGGDLASGWNYALIEAGAEIRVGRQNAVGPFVGASVGEYSSVSAPETYLTSEALHEWVQIGLRGTINY